MTTIKLHRHLTVTDLTPSQVDYLSRQLTLRNPAYDEAMLRRKRGLRSRLPTEYLRYYRYSGGIFHCPSGTLQMVLDVASNAEVEYDVVSQLAIAPIGYFHGDLRDYQSTAVGTVASHGIIHAPTGSGKTVMALALASWRGLRTLIITHTSALAEQWCAACEQFLWYAPARQFGGKHEYGPIMVGIINSVTKVARELAPEIGHLIIDECHRVPARSWAKAVGEFSPRYKLGLSATPFRRDGLSKAVEWLIGPMIHIDRGRLVRDQRLVGAEYVRRYTEFRTLLSASDCYQAVISALTEDHDRNCLIAADVAACVAPGGPPMLVLSDRKAHCELLQRYLRAAGVSSVVITGDLSAQARAAELDRVAAGVQVIIGTAQLLGEGWDLPAASQLFLATPIKWRGRLIQMVGRVLRPAPGKDKATIVDYVDVHMPVLARSARTRYATYLREIA